MALENGQHQKALRRARNERYRKKSKSKPRPRTSPSIDPDELQRQKELRRARNRRYQQKLKSKLKKGDLPSSPEVAPASTCKAANSNSGLEEASGAEASVPMSTTAKACRPPPILQRSPISIPLTNDIFLVKAFKSLNRQLAAWGYSDQPNDVLYRRLQAEWTEGLERTEDVAQWIVEKEDWVERGDELIELIQKCMWTEVMNSCQGHKELLAEFWDQLSRVAFRVQYMIAAVEFRVDTLYLP